MDDRQEQQISEQDPARTFTAEELGELLGTSPAPQAREFTFTVEVTVHAGSEAEARQKLESLIGLSYSLPVPDNREA